MLPASFGLHFILCPFVSTLYMTIDSAVHTLRKVFSFYLPCLTFSVPFLPHTVSCLCSCYFVTVVLPVSDYDTTHDIVCFLIYFG